jgi:hypothetical protein
MSERLSDRCHDLEEAMKTAIAALDMDEELYMDDQNILEMLRAALDADY